MNSKLANQLYGNLDKLINSGAFVGKSIILFGANKPSELTTSYLNSRQFRVDAIIDNDPEKHNKTLNGVLICKPAEILKNNHKDLILLIASTYYRQMRNSIAKYDLTKTEIIETLYFHEYSLEPKIFQKNADIAIDGWFVYDRIKKTYGDNAFIVLNPCPSLGDTYMLFSYLDEYIVRNGIDNYVVVVSGGGALKIAEMFNAANCLKISQDDNDALLALYTLMDLPDVIVAAYNFPYTRLTAANHGLELLNWGELIRETVLRLEPDTIKVLPNKPSQMKDIAFFENNKLEKGKTVLLAPTAVHALNLPDAFWSALVTELNHAGYTVRLNLAADEAVTIEGAEPIFVPLEDIIPFIEIAGVFIALRNGLCDVLSEAEAKKIAIYPDKDYFNFFGMKKIGLTESFNEVVYENNNQTIQHIMEYIKNQ